MHKDTTVRVLFHYVKIGLIWIVEKDCLQGDGVAKQGESSMLKRTPR